MKTIFATKKVRDPCNEMITPRSPDLSLSIFPAKHLVVSSPLQNEPITAKLCNTVGHEMPIGLFEPRSCSC